MSFSFEHPNAGGVLLPGQTCCHTGKLIRRKIHGDPLADPLLPELCPKLCSPIGVFPKDHDKPKKKPSGASEDASDEDVQKAIYEQMGTVYDPEIPVDIVELGLIYRCELSRREDNQVDVAIDMTLTAPGCGMGDFLVNDVRSKVQALPVVGDVTVNLVFDPPWRQDMMSESAQLAVGFF